MEILDLGHPNHKRPFWPIRCRRSNWTSPYSLHVYDIEVVFHENDVLIENERFCEFLILKTIVTFLEQE